MTSGFQVQYQPLGHGNSCHWLNDFKSIESFGQLNKLNEYDRESRGYDTCMAAFENMKDSFWKTYIILDCLMT